MQMYLEGLGTVALLMSRTSGIYTLCSVVDALPHVCQLFSLSCGPGLLQCLSKHGPAQDHHLGVQPEIEHYCGYSRRVRETLARKTVHINLP